MYDFDDVKKMPFGIDPVILDQMNGQHSENVAHGRSREPQKGGKSSLIARALLVSTRRLEIPQKRGVDIYGDKIEDRADFTGRKVLSA